MKDNEFDITDTKSFILLYLGFMVLILASATVIMYVDSNM